MTDVGMAEAGNSARLAVKALEQVGIGREVSGKNLDGDGTVKASIAGD